MPIRFEVPPEAELTVGFVCDYKTGYKSALYSHISRKHLDATPFTSLTQTQLSLHLRCRTMVRLRQLCPLPLTLSLCGQKILFVQ